MQNPLAVPKVSLKDASNCKDLKGEYDLEGLIARKASQILWAHGKLSEPIPNGFYSILLEKGLKELFDMIPSLDELYAMDLKGIALDVVIVDLRKDKKLSMLKQLTLTLVKGLRSNPVAVIKKIAGLVADCCKPYNMKDAMLEGSDALESQGIHMLGQMRHGSCHPRAILFKVLADAAGIDSMLVAGLPREGVMERTDSYKHMSVLVVLDSVETLVDLVRHPGQLIPCSTKAILMCHIFVAGGSDSPENDSCDSPLEPSSPLCNLLDLGDLESTEYDESPQDLYQRRLEAAVAISGSSMNRRSRTMMKEQLNLSHSEPYVPNTFWVRSGKNVIAEQRTATSSPDPDTHMQARGRSNLGRHADPLLNFGEASRSTGASPTEFRRRRRRSISMIPEISDDIVRVVRAMTETIKNLPKDVDALSSSSAGEDHNHPDLQVNVSDFHQDERDKFSGESFAAYTLQKKKSSYQKAISLPSSPHKFSSHDSERSGAIEYVRSADMISTWNHVIRSSEILNKPLLPYPEWNIDFSELTVGPRVGIGFFGEVFRGHWNGTEVAIKVLLEQELTVDNIEDFCNEISILSRLRHPNVISFLGACTMPPRLSLITEFMEMGSLYYLIHVSGQKKRLSWRRKLKMMCDICRGLMCIHRMKVAHRDLKSANCLVSRYWTVKICDFGLSRVLTTTPMRDSSSAGTPEWMAPELIRNEPFTEKCDIFSLGVIIWELYTLNRPWKGVPSAQVIYTVAHDGLRLEIPDGPLGELIADCWAEPDQRPSCEEVFSRLCRCENTQS
ncbi:hypothetical protein DCAR_0104264 [Daucus carota subsp. sativus]|uniref:non-specific serine/threonine protein kinase n=1 Tax=Daucus carota subsp. sativus TaxID=79200 RepID=A0AAF0W8Y8_DAUCS|nr:hypothetical protein DCAR_0104264 [Daucus carota subsp. sativus]